jgi:preprotein translocase subunit SecA
VLDHKWREHLYEMDYLREGIGLRAMAQRDPLVEYQREGFDMFNTMMEGIKEESVAYLFNSKVDVQPSPIVEEAGGELPAASLALGQVPGNGAPGGVIEDSVAPAGPAPVDGSPVDGSPVDGAPAQRSGRRGSGGRGSRGRHAKNGPAQPAAAQPPVDQRPAAGAPGVVTPGLSQPQRPARLSYSAPSVDGEAQVQRRAESTDGGEFGKVGRNAPCPCGSGRKYKLCHGDPRNRPAG